jgi:two-component system, NarL family, nitrate/nitrite response regulator NarL
MINCTASIQQVETNRSVVPGALIVSELRFLRDSLAEILSRVPAIQVCGQASTVSNALTLAEAMRPEIVLLDVAFPGGTETAAELCAVLPAVNVIALGVRETEESVLAWAAAGAVGYVPNTASVDDLVSLVGQISRGEQSCPSHIAGSLLRRIASSGRGLTVTSSAASRSLILTHREQQIFRLVGAGLSNKAIARRLCISLGTTKSHVHNLLGKLSLKRRTDVISRTHNASL